MKIHPSFRDPSVVEFVLENSGDYEDNDTLPGLCKLLETWLMEVVFTRFRETKGVTEKIKDLGVKVMCAGVVIGLTTLAGMKLLPGRSGSAIPHRHLGSAVASDVSSVGNGMTF